LRTNTINQTSKAEILRQSGFTSKQNHDNADIFDEFENHEKSENDNNITVWETPVPFDDINLPEFPVNELPVIISDYVRAVAETTQTMPDMAATASLAIIALCSQGKFVIEGKKDWIEPLNLYTLIIAPPAERKSAVLKHMLIPVHQYETEENNRLEPLIQQNIIEYNVLLKQKKMLEDKIAKSKSDKSEIKDISEEISGFEHIIPCRLYFDDITPQKLSGVLSENKGKSSIIS